MSEKISRTKIAFVVGIIVGSAVTSLFCQFNMSSIPVHIYSKRRVSHEIAPNTHPVTPLLVSLDQRDPPVSLDQRDQPSVHILDRYRHIWTKMELSGVYPPVNDAQPSIRAEPFPANVCLTTGTPVVANWTLLSKTNGWNVPRSAGLVLKPEPSTTPYRGHVKVCMYRDLNFWWQNYWQKYGTCVGEEYCDLPCGDIHCRYSWQNQHWRDCSAEILHHRLDSFVGPEEHIRKVFTITEPLYKFEDLLNEQSRDARSKIDIVAQWHRSANVFLTAHNNQFTKEGEEAFARDMDFGHLSCPPKPEVVSNTSAERRIGLTVFNHGNCETADGFREKFVQELLQYIHIDAYGACLHNKEKPSAPEWGYQQEMELRSHYKFALAFENEVAEDWVTEKVYHGLASGAVPVYYGAPNVDEFLPCTDCIIDVTKFAGPKELAKYMIFLDKNPDKYMEYHAWRRRPMRVPPFMEASKSYFYCGVCRAVAEDIEGNSTKVKFNQGTRHWVPDSDPGRKKRPVPPSWSKGFDDLRQNKTEMKTKLE